MVGVDRPDVGNEMKSESKILKNIRLQQQSD